MRVLTLAVGLLAGYGATRLALDWRRRTRGARNPYRAAMREFLRQERQRGWPHTAPSAPTTERMS